MPITRSLSALAGLAAIVEAAPLVQRQDISTPYLNDAAQVAGKLWFGSAIDTTSAEYQDQAYMTVFNSSRLWGQTTPGNTMKWEFVEPTQNEFTFDQGQVTIDLAQQTGKLVRCHNLVWQSELPSWVTSPSTPWTNETLLAAMENHITKTVQHYGDNCYSWDVVNEALNQDGSFSSDIFYQTIGAAYVPLAFQYARAAVNSFGGSVKLFYNDFNIEYPGTKNTAAVQLVETILSYGDNIDGVGFESHFIVGEAPSAASQEQAMAGFTALGMDIHQTEIDVRFQTLPPSDADLAQQASDYSNTVEACMNTPLCRGMTVWDFDDKYSWIPQTFSGQGDADLYWANLTRKPAFDAVYSAIIAGGSSAPTSTTTSVAPSSATSTTTTTSLPTPSRSKTTTMLATTTATAKNIKSTKTTKPTKTTKAPETTTTTTTTPSALTPAQTHWGQCGGQGWTGPTTCASPWTCQEQNPYYSQCL